jgi:hypothetical protein
VARNCPKDQVRALVEGTLDLEDSLSQDVVAHVEGCSSCRRLRAKLETKERAFRAALSAFMTDEDSRCPSPAEVATVAERGLDDANSQLVDHIARCAICRMTLAAVSSAGNKSAATHDETIAAARRRVAVARTSSDEHPARQGKTASTGRVPNARRRTARQVALFEDRSSRAGLVAAAVACFIVAFTFFAFVRDNPTPAPSPDNENIAQPPKQKQPARPIEPKLEAPRVEQPTPRKPVEEEQVVAKVDKPSLPPIEEEPRELEPAVNEEPTPAPQPPQVAQVPQEKKPAETTPPPAPSTTEPRVAQGPKTPPVPTTPQNPPPPKSEPGTLACTAVTGPMEVRKKSEKTWKKLSVADLIHDGDGVRAKGEDGSITFANKAIVNFDGEATGTVTITSKGVNVNLDAGGLEGETLAYDGLKVTQTNGWLTAWKGSKVRLEVTERGLRVCVDKGTANCGNELGKVTVHAGQEILLVADKLPERPSSLHGPYRTPRGR